MEQIDRIRKYVCRMTPYANRINMREYCGITSDRFRLIASKRPLRQLQQLDGAEYKKRFTPLRQLLKEEYLNRVDKPPYIDSDQMLFKNSYNHLRTGDQPGFTVTGSAIRYGLDGANMQPLGKEVQLKSMGIDLSKWKIPEELALCDSKILRMFAQCVPPPMMEEIAIAQHNEWTDYGRHGGMPIFKGDGTPSEYVLDDVRMVRVDDVWRACRVIEVDKIPEGNLNIPSNIPNIISLVVLGSCQVTLEAKPEYTRETVAATQETFSGRCACGS